jgi:hypothetical protein
MRLGAGDEALFSFTKPTAHRSPPLLVIDSAGRYRARLRAFGGFR